MVRDQTYQPAETPRQMVTEIAAVLKFLCEQASSPLEMSGLAYMGLICREIAKIERAPMAGAVKPREAKDTEPAGKILAYLRMEADGLQLELTGRLLEATALLWSVCRDIELHYAEREPQASTTQ